MTHSANVAELPRLRNPAIGNGRMRGAEAVNAVPKTGSLGLLATGGKGLKAWRQQKQELFQ